MSEWREFKLDNLIKIKHGYAFKGEYFSDEVTTDILVTPGNFLIGGGFKHDKLKYYKGPILKDYVLKKNDFIVTMTDLSKKADTLGFSARVPEIENCTFLHNQRIGLLQLKEINFDLSFIYWLMRTEEYQRFVAGSATGSTVKHTSPTKICEYKFIAPIDINIQKRIASILSAYDDFIENNLRRIKLLEELAQRTYEEWFVKFIINGKQLGVRENGLPDGWEKKTLGKLIGYEIGGGWGEEEISNEFDTPGYVIRGTDFNNLTKGSINNVPYRFHKKSNMFSRKIEDGDILFEVSGGSSFEGVAKTALVTKELLNQFDCDVMCASFCKLVRPSSELYSKFLFQTFRFFRKVKTTEIWEIRSASNIVNYNWTAFLKFQTVKVPDTKTLQAFNNLANPIYSEIYLLANQNRLLKESRDILLPRLMSGQIEVGEGLGMVAETSEKYSKQ
jgi:type I restriction enzyme, S subunit